MAYDEIARVLHLPIGTVRSRISRAREALRVQLTDLVGSEG
jgi:DNA-directed RNA polymerase specialized sigma24 family protein